MSNKGNTRGLVSLTQIKLLATELNKGYPFGECYRDSVLVYSVSKGRGIVKIVGKGYKLADGESLFLNEKGLQKLAYGFYNCNTSRTILDGSKEYLYNEVNKLVAEKIRNRPTVERVEDSYKLLQTFKKYYSQVPVNRSIFIVCYQDYDLTKEEMGVLAVTFKKALIDLAKENKLKVKVSESRGFAKFVLPYYDKRAYRVDDVYEESLYTFLVGKGLSAVDFKELTEVFKNLYKAPKEGYVKGLLSDASTYLLYLEFLAYLFKGMEEYNLTGLLEWHKKAEKIRGNKQRMQELAKRSS